MSGFSSAATTFSCFFTWPWGVAFSAIGVFAGLTVFCGFGVLAAAGAFVTGLGFGVPVAAVVVLIGVALAVLSFRGGARWLIVADHAQGRGLGRRLLGEALAHADAAGWDGVYLTTFDGLGPARRLYEQAGFVLVSEADIDQWCGGVREQRFERRRAEGAA